MNVAVDAMGGDHAPEMVVQGAVEAVSELGIDITLVGHEKKIAKALDTRPAHGHISFHHCEDVVEMDESPLKALREKKLPRSFLDGHYAKILGKRKRLWKI